MSSVFLSEKKETFRDIVFNMQVSVFIAFNLQASDSTEFFLSKYHDFRTHCHGLAS